MTHLVDDLTGHGRCEDDGTFLVSLLLPEGGSLLGADELSKDIGVIYVLVIFVLHFERILDN